MLSQMFKYNDVQVFLMHTESGFLYTAGADAYISLDDELTHPVKSGLTADAIKSKVPFIEEKYASIIFAQQYLSSSIAVLC